MRSALASLRTKLLSTKSYSDWKRQFAVTTTYLGIAQGVLTPEDVDRQVADAIQHGDRQLAASLKALKHRYSQIQQQPALAPIRRSNARAARKMKELRPNVM